MRKSLAGFMAAVSMSMLVSTASATEGWRVIPMAAWSQTFRDVTYVGRDSVWAVGADGLIVHSFNGGKIWYTQSYSTTLDLQAVFFIDWRTGWAVGQGGLILHTRDGGHLWRQQTSNTSLTLMAIHFVDADNGWAAGEDGVIRHTTNGGMTWQIQDSQTNYDITAIHFVDGQHGWFSTNYGSSFYSRSEIHFTDNGGSNWRLWQDGLRDLFALQFFDSQTGWAVGRNGSVYYKSAGDSLWQTRSYGTSSIFYAVYFVDSLKGWAAGSSGIVVHTIDGGLNWTAQPSGFSGTILSLAFADQQRGLLVGTSGSIFGTENAGQTWKSRNYGTTSDLYSVCFADSLHGWAVGDRTIIYTRDGGETWNMQYSSSTILYDAFCTDSLRAWVVGSGGLVLHTIDHGETWVRQNAETSAHLYGIHFTDVLNGWLVGASGTVRFTTDGGTFWREPQSVTGTSSTLYDLFVANPKLLWACGTGGTVLHTSNGGQTWTRQQSGFSGTYDYFDEIFFIDNSTGWAAGGYSLSTPRGRIIFTTNGGASWTQQNPVTMSDLYGIHFINSNKGWAVGNDGRIVNTENGGTAWDFEQSRTSISLRDVFFTDERHGWAVGLGGTVLKYEGGLRYWADVDDNGKVDIVDIQLVASRWGYKIGDPGYGAIYDLNNQGTGDGVIDIIDIQLVANEWGWPNNGNLLKKPLVPTNVSSVIASLDPVGTDKAGNYLFGLRGQSIAGLTAFEIELLFDEKTVEIIDVELGALYQNEKQVSIALGPHRGNQGNLRFGGFSLKPFGDNEGELATFTLKAPSRQEIDLAVAKLFFVDKDANRINVDATTSASGQTGGIPEQFILYQNYPNPFNPSTSIEYALAAPSRVTLEIYNVLGVKIATIIDLRQPAGFHVANWNGADESGRQVPSGVYFYRLQASPVEYEFNGTAEFTEVKKLTLVR